MAGEVPPLRSFRFDDDIEGDDVLVDIGDGLAQVSKADAIAIAPCDDNGEVNDDDVAAWRSATRRFRETGTRYGTWGDLLRLRMCPAPRHGRRPLP